MQKLSDIEKKAYVCLDEFYPDDPLSADEGGFPIDKFVKDAVRYVGRMVPVSKLGAGTDFKPTSKPSSNSIDLPANFVRLISFQMDDWALPIVDIIPSDDPRYRLQANPILKGTVARPIIFLCDGGTTLEYYSSSSNTVKKAKAFCVNDSDAYYPDELADLIAWKTTELVLSALNNTQAIPFAQAQVKQLLESL